MSRLQRFEAHALHPINGKLFRKLSVEEREKCRQFIRSNGHLDRNEFGHMVNRWMLDEPNKPKNHTTMWALVSQCLVE